MESDAVERTVPRLRTLLQHLNSCRTAGQVENAHIILLGGSGNRSLCQLMTSIVVAYFKGTFPPKLLFTGHGRTEWTHDAFRAAILDPTIKTAGWPSASDSSERGG